MRGSKRMRRIFALLVTAVALCVLTVPAFADVIWTPEDDFFEQHDDACTYVGRSYYANAQAGSVAVCKEPGGKELASAANGAEFYVSFTYDLDGDAWGVVEYDVNDGTDKWLGWKTGKKSGTGWVKMDDLLVIYDQQSFEEEHSAAFKAYAGGFDAVLASDDQRVIVWTYPGSGEMTADFEKLNHDYADAMSVDRQWTDEDGLVWGHVGYYMGARGWVCLSDPSNQDLPVTKQTVVLYPAAQNVADVRTAEEDAVPAQTGDAENAGLIVGVAAVCGITGLLLVMMRRKNTD